MQNTTTTRKRPAPGTSPLPPTQAMPQQAYQYQQQPLDNNDFNFEFNPVLPASEQAYSDPNAFDYNTFSHALNTSQAPTYGSNIAPAPSTELVRRTRNQQLAPQNHAQQEQWNSFGNANPTTDDEDEQDLEQRAALAKKDAQAKRKQIPPFVQKLSSFLDSNNTDLIRWSDDGRSFIVLDEDEFARTLIPELFKHNNYASFVRQLNMYGFHKTVNITDGSLRQSEKARKGVKPPSMYSHPYFRKNRPDLLWLIQKPAGGKATKRKRDGNMKDPDDSDDERQYSPVPEGLPQLNAPPSTSQDLTQLPRNEIAAVRRELQSLQTQQRFISQMITQLKEQNDQFYRQATAFQALHDRHENSINAILTFLATFYNRSLDGHGAQNLVNMFTNAQQSQQQHGSVVEEYNDATPTPSNQVQRYVKRQPLLLPGPATNNTQNLQPGSAVTEPSSARASATPPNDRNSVSSAPQSATEPTMKTDAPTPNYLNQVPESNDQMMNIINNANATSQATTPGSTTAAPALDTSSMVDKLIGNAGGAALTPQQRDNMVANIVNSSNASYDSALTAYKDRLGSSQHSLEYLQRLQKKQDEKVQELNRRLQPLSPTGSIPGIPDYGNQDPFDSLAGAPGDFDPNAFVNFDFDGGPEGDYDFAGAFGGDGNSGQNWGQFDDGDDIFGTSPMENNGGTGGGGGEQLGVPADDAGRIESVSGSEATSPTGLDEPGTPSKRQRRS